VWGENYYGLRKVPVAAQRGVTAVAAAAGASHVVALKNDGSVVAWGFNLYGQTTVPAVVQHSGVTAMAAGYDNTVVLIIPTAPAITTPPINQAVNVGQSTSFTVAATGIYLSYQWRKNGTNLSEATGA